MGRKSREKRKRREQGEVKPKRERPEVRPVAICRGVILIATGLALFSPLIVSGEFFFPFVGPKSIYFMGWVEVMFAAWLVLITFSKRYRPRFNVVLLVLILFVIILILSSVYGADFSRSFWSKYERMTGLLMWFHLLAFFLVISSTFRKKSDWFKIFGISVFVAVLIGFVSLPRVEEAVMGDYPTRGGATIGNSSFLGTYLLFNIFLALYLLLKTRGGLRIYSSISLAILTSALLLSDARAAILSFLGGLVLLGLLWLVFCQKGKLRLVGLSLLIIFTIGTITLMYLALQPDSVVYQKVVAIASKSRIAVWQAAWKGFLERPWLGWGPENFELAFYRHFDPRLGLREYGGEVWFDRAHNIIFDTLVASGIIGLLAYIGIFLAAFFVIWKKYFCRAVDFWIPGIISVILISYSVQNLTVFDMVNSYLMFFLVLGFTATVASLKKNSLTQTTQEISFFNEQPSFSYQKVSSWKKAVSIVIVILFCIPFFKFIIQPLKTDGYVIDAIRASDPSQKIALFQKTLETSPLGKYQIREFFSDSVISFALSEEARTTPEKDIIEEEFEYVTKELEKSIAESPHDYRAYLKLGKTYNAYSRYDPSKRKRAEEILTKAIELSPSNQQAYWSLAETKFFQRDFEVALTLAEKAVGLEPRIGDSHLVVVKIYLFMGDRERALQRAKEALKIVPVLKPELEQLLGEGSLGD